MQTVETLNEGLKRGYTLTIPAGEIAARVDAEVARAAPQVRMPGFRPGKVPANLIRKMHGPAMAQEALNSAVQQSVQALLTEQALRPAMQPAVELGEGYEPGQDAEVKVSLEVLPQVPAPAIEGLKLERLTVKAGEAEVDAQLARLATQQKSYDAAPEGHPAIDGDLVIMDFVGKVDGVAFEGGTGTGMSVTLGSGQLIPGFESGLEGVKSGESRTLNVTFPADYTEKKLAGQAATFDVTVTEVKVPKDGATPDDDFAKTLGLESIEQLRSLLKGQVEQELNGLTRTHMKRKLLDQLAASHDFPVPPSMVEAEFGQIWRQLEHEAGHEADPQAALAEMESEREDYRRIAERRVRLGLLLSEIGQQNGVEVSQQEMQRLAMQAAQQYQASDRERFLQYIQQDAMAAAQLRAPLYEDKVVDFLFGKAEISDRSVAREELEAAIEAEDDGSPKPHVHGPDCDHDHDDTPAAKPKKTTKKAQPAISGDEAPAAADPIEPVSVPVKRARKVAPATTDVAAEVPSAEEAPALHVDPADGAPVPAPKKRAAKKAQAEG